MFLFHNAKNKRKASKLVSGKKAKSKKELKMDEEEVKVEEKAKEVSAAPEAEQPEPEKAQPEAKKEEPVVSTQEQVQVEEQVPIAVNVEDLVTKEMLHEAISAITAKYEAIVKENEDLKKKLSETKDKYEKGDFGYERAKGVQTKNNSANDSFDEYAKQFI